MKRSWIAALALVFAAGFVPEAGAQVLMEGPRYEIRSDLSEADTAALAKELDRRFEVYNGLFRFDPSRLEGKLKVRAFADKDAYEEYLRSTLGETRDDACYLHYSRPERCELVVYRRTGSVFSHQAFIQFLRAFLPQPPLWMREGFAVVFEPLLYNAADDSFSFEENLAWLETVKKWGAEAPSIERVMLSDDAESVSADKLTPASWALASFILNTDGEDYRRFLYESFLLMKSGSSAAETARIVAARGAAWIDPERAQADYDAYIKSRRTFAELVEDGRAAYAAKDPSAAERAFLAAVELRPSHYAPQYYLGLLAYERKDYATAELRYKNALSYGADEALCSFALGVNAAAAARPSDARAFLERAKTVAPSRYAARVDELLSKLR